MIKSKKTTFLAPYTAERKKNINSLFWNKKQIGVYFLKEGEQIIYVGYSGSQLCKTIYRHFQTWNDSQQERFVYDPQKIKVRIIFLNDKKRAEVLEKYLVKKLKPRDNKQKFENEELNKKEILQSMEILENSLILPNKNEEAPF